MNYADCKYLLDMLVSKKEYGKLIILDLHANRILPEILHPLWGTQFKRVLDSYESYKGKEGVDLHPLSQMSPLDILLPNIYKEAGNNNKQEPQTNINNNQDQEQKDNESNFVQEEGVVGNNYMDTHHDVVANNVNEGDIMGNHMDTNSAEI